MASRSSLRRMGTSLSEAPPNASLDLISQNLATCSFLDHLLCVQGVRIFATWNEAHLEHLPGGWI